jgi:hypothetical protein
VLAANEVFAHITLSAYSASAHSRGAGADEGNSLTNDHEGTVL